MKKTAVSVVAERREVLRRAAGDLQRLARHSAFLPSYARMNPAAGISANAFFFASPGKPPRIVLLGPWAYVHAPGVRLPVGVEELKDEYRSSKHLGALHARVLLDSERALGLVFEIATRLRASGQRNR